MIPVKQKRPLWAEIDLGAIVHNFGIVRRLVGPKTKIMAVVKANAYGHGSLEVARSLVSAGADALGVARLSEAKYLRGEGDRVTDLDIRVYAIRVRRNAGKIQPPTDCIFPVLCNTA